MPGIHCKCPAVLLCSESAWQTLLCSRHKLFSRIKYLAVPYLSRGPLWAHLLANWQIWGNTTGPLIATLVVAPARPELCTVQQDVCRSGLQSWVLFEQCYHWAQLEIKYHVFRKTECKEWCGLRSAEIVSLQWLLLKPLRQRSSSKQIEWSNEQLWSESHIRAWVKH